jgi:DNA (cytosine-5)-methyltransferase 1
MALPPGRAIDLFAGAGGLGLGLTLSGHQVVLSADIDSDACKTLASNTGNAHAVVRADLTSESELNGLIDHALDLVPDIDLVVGGPPCQGFSTAGPCRVDDPRNRLVLAFLVFVERTRPRRVLMENVPALQWRGSAFLHEVRERLSAMGYVTDTVILHAEAYGVPQLRRRLFVQGTLEGPVQWPAPTHSIVEPAFPGSQPGKPGTGPSVTVQDAIGDLSLSAVEDVDTLVRYASPATSALQRWARGDLTIHELVPTATIVEGAGNQQHQLPLLS